MSDVLKTLFVAFIACFVLATGPALALMPANTGAHSPSTVWSDTKGTVSGKVVTSLDRTKGVDGAYVALVNAMNPAEAYYNTTSDANGNFRFTDVNATYSSTIFKGPDGTGGTYQQGETAYMIYANKSSVGEGFSDSFGVDTNHTNTATGLIIIYAGIPSSDDVATPEPTATVKPTAVPTPAPATATPVPPTPTPGPAVRLPTGLPLIAAIIVVLVIAAAAGYFLFLRKR